MFSSQVLQPFLFSYFISSNWTLEPRQQMLRLQIKLLLLLLLISSVNVNLYQDKNKEQQDTIKMDKYTIINRL